MSVLVKEVIEKLRLDIVYGEPELLEKEINTADITRPGLEMTGYFDYYTPERIQLLYKCKKKSKLNRIFS